MARTITVYGTGNRLSTDRIYPPITLDHTRYEYSLGLVGLYTSHTIRNIYPGKNKFYYGEKEITIEPGSYEFAEIVNYIKNQISGDPEEGDLLLQIKANTNTGKCEIESTTELIDFTKPDNIGPLLGFKKRVLEPGSSRHVSDRVVDILSTPNIFVDTNITGGSYRNNQAGHTIFEFGVCVPPGYLIEKEPSHVIYFPITVTEIDNITIRLVDARGELINLSEDTFTSIRLELKREKWE